MSGQDYADAWKKWFHLFETAANPLSSHMIDRAGVRSGARVLDIASGLGEPAITAAHRLMPEGEVIATDISPHMLAFARERAARHDLTNVHFAVMDAARPAVSNASFDAITCRWGLMFVPDLQTVLGRLRALLRPGGRLVAAVWGDAAEVPAVALSSRVVRSHLGLPPPEEGAGTPFALADVQALERLMTEAGFAQARSEWLDVRFRFGSADEFVRFRRDRSAALNGAIAHFPPDRQEAAWQALAEHVRPWTGTDGTLDLSNAACCVTAVAPEG